MVEKAQRKGSEKKTVRGRHPLAPATGDRAKLPREADALVLQRVVSDPAAAAPGDILALQRAAGNRAVSRFIQRKLTVGAAGDRYEQEADRIAEQVVGKQQAPSSKQQGVQRQEEEEEIQPKPLDSRLRGNDDRELLRRQEEDEIQTKRLDSRLRGNDGGEVLRRKADGSFEAGRAFEDRLAAHKGSGSPLPAKTRAFMEPRFGSDFSGVRVHTGSDAALLNRQIKAQAFTQGQDIYMGAGRYDPGTAAGQRLLAHELTHTIQQTGRVRARRMQSSTLPISHQGQRKVQRALLDADEIIGALDKIAFLGKSGTGKLEKESFGKKTRERIRLVLTNYQEHFRGGKGDALNNAMMMAMALDAVANVIAEEIHDPFIQPKIAEKLFELYKDDIQKKVRSAMRPKLAKGERATPHAKKAMDLAGKLVGRDPVSRYMHDEIRTDQAVTQICEMADDVMPEETDETKRHLAMYGLLSQRFQSQIAAYTYAEVKEHQNLGVKVETQGTDKRAVPSTELGGSYATREAPGQLSERYFHLLFGSEDIAPKQIKALRSNTTMEDVGEAGPRWQGGGRRLDFSKYAMAKLKTLRQAVADPPKQRNFVPRPGVKTAKQEQHLKEIEEAEQGMQGSGEQQTVEEKLAQFFYKNYHILESEAYDLLGDVKSWLRDEAPLTITRQAKNLFGQHISRRQRKILVDPGTAESRHVKVKDILGRGGDLEKLTHVAGKWEDRPGYEPRGESYRVFRIWKDRLMTSLLDFENAELPVFGALSPGWESTKGSDAPIPEEYGTNYYGSVHLLLDRDRVKNRLVYTATDHGVPRRDPVLALADFLDLGGGPSKTKLKGTFDMDMVNAIVLAAKNKGTIFKNLVFEMQIFGDVDILKDVKEIYLADSVGKVPFRRAKRLEGKGSVQKVARVGAMTEQATSLYMGPSQLLFTPPPLTDQEKRELAPENLTPELQKNLKKATRWKSKAKTAQVDTNIKMQILAPIRGMQTEAFNILKKNPRLPSDFLKMKEDLGRMAVQYQALQKSVEKLKKSYPSLPALLGRAKTAYERALGHVNNLERALV